MRQEQFHEISKILSDAKRYDLVPKLKDIPLKNMEAISTMVGNMRAHGNDPAVNIDSTIQTCVVHDLECLLNNTKVGLHSEKYLVRQRVPYLELDDE